MPSWEKVRAIIMAAGTGAVRAMAIIIAIPTAILAGILLVAFFARRSTIRTWVLPQGAW